jgi:hypothetical protein
MNIGAMYVCPMHADVRVPAAGRCPHCGMALVQEGARFALVRHMLGNPLHVAVMVAVMVAIMAGAMMIMR